MIPRSPESTGRTCIDNCGNVCLPLPRLGDAYRNVGQYSKGIDYLDFSPDCLSRFRPGSERRICRPRNDRQHRRRRRATPGKLTLHGELR